MKQSCPFSFHRLIAIICVFTCYSNHALAQKAFDCSKLLKQNIEAGNQQALDNITMHADCFGLDSVDIRIYGQGPILGTMLVARATKSNKKITYGDIMTDINAAKRDTGYASMRNLITAQMTLEKRRFTPDNWDSSLKYLQVIGMPGGDTEGFHNYALEKREHHWTYRQLIVAYQMKKEAETPVKQR